MRFIQVGLTLILSLYFYYIPTVLHVEAVTITCIVLNLTLGLVHGCNDLLLLRNYFETKKTRLWGIIVYVLIIPLLLSLYFIAPVVVSILLLGLSAYHFGEQHATNLVVASKGVYAVLYLGLGLLIFSLLFLLNYNELAQVLSLFGFGFITYEVLKTTVVLAVVIQLIISLSLAAAREVRLKEFLFFELELILLAFSFLVMDLFVGFTVYFIIWHSVPSIVKQSKILFGNNQTMTVLRYFSNAIVIYIISLTAIAAIFFYLQDSVSIAVIVPLVLLFTVPHIVTISVNYYKDVTS
ncbi:MAG: Brp/Blh family beta-carotene 15,15'-dioxygenase [Nonlabens sp.]|nr:Brp/Blh family beta-carotene 15,15'-dioxygenase [Nonlabens sp.]